MPWIDVKLYDTRVTDESVPKIVEALTKALHESSGAATEHIHVLVHGIPPKYWGSDGKVHRDLSGFGQPALGRIGATARPGSSFQGTLAGVRFNFARDVVEQADPALRSRSGSWTTRRQRPRPDVRRGRRVGGALGGTAAVPWASSQATACWCWSARRPTGTR